MTSILDIKQKNHLFMTLTSKGLIIKFPILHKLNQK